MKIPSILKATALAVALGISGASSAAILFDHNGDTAPGGFVVTDLFDWVPGNVLFDNMIPIPEDPASITFDLYYQASLGAFGGTLDTGAEVTIQVVLPMAASIIASGGGTDIVFDAILPGGTLDMYYDNEGIGGLGTTGGVEADDISGTGYGDGRHILHGAVEAFTAGQFGTVNIGSVITTLGTGLLDQFNSDDQGGVLTVDISGNLRMDVEIVADAGSSNADVVAMGFDDSFFVPDMNGDTIDVPDDGDPLTDDTDLSLTFDNTAPFENANPSDLIVGVAPDYGSGPGVYPGEINDGSCITGTGAGAGSSTPCDLHAEADGRSPFKANQVPEPTTLAMLGLGLLGMGAYRKRS